MDGGEWCDGGDADLRIMNEPTFSILHGGAWLNQKYLCDCMTYYLYLMCLLLYNYFIPMCMHQRNCIDVVIYIAMQYFVDELDI